MENILTNPELTENALCVILTMLRMNTILYLPVHGTLNLDQSTLKNLL